MSRHDESKNTVLWLAARAAKSPKCYFIKWLKHDEANTALWLAKMEPFPAQNNWLSSMKKCVK